MDKETKDVKKVGNYDETTKFINDHIKLISDKPGKIIYQMNRDPYVKFMTSKGITKDSLEQITDANHEFMHGSMLVAKDKLVEHNDEDRVELRFRCPDGRQDVIIKRSKDVRNLKSGETFTKYGTVSVIKRLRTQMDKGIIDAIAAEIEKTV
jgi:hypothetical protein